MLYVHVCFQFAGVGGIEAEAVMLGQPISMVLPKVVGYKLMGQMNPLATSTDVVLTITKVSVSICTLLSIIGRSTMLFKLYMCMTKSTFFKAKDC